jgi:hypothetical protein
MITLHVPTDATVKAIASVVGYLTDGLDAVVTDQKASITKIGFIEIRVEGNPRDLGIVAERADRLGSPEQPTPSL